MQSELLNVNEAAQYLRLSKSLLNQWRCAGDGPTYRKLGGRVAYLRRDLDQFIDNSACNSVAQGRAA